MEHREYSELRSVAEEAAEWFVRLDSGELSLAQQREYLSWLNSSARNTAEALRVSQLFGLLRACLGEYRADRPDDPAYTRLQ